MIKLKVKNWSEFQHYKDRAPPWIKLHKALLDDYEYQCLPLASRALAPMIWLLASEYKDGIFDGSIDKVCFRLRITEKDYLSAVNPLIKHKFITSASNPLATCLQDAMPETEGETEEETEVEGEKSPVCPRCPIQKIIDLYHSTLPTLPKNIVRNSSRDENIRARWKEFFLSGDLSDEETGLECFKKYFVDCVLPSKFLMGKTEGSNGKPPFSADLEWLMKPTNFAKVIEGKYIK